jgi:hypothetical protein
LDQVVIVAGAPSTDDDVVVVVANDAKEGRAIVVDGIPVSMPSNAFLLVVDTGQNKLK